MSDELRDLIKQAGGLLTKAQLAARWGISRQRVDELSAMSDFPAPVHDDGRRKLYAFNECDDWRHWLTRQQRPPGRPRKEPA